MRLLILTWDDLVRDVMQLARSLRGVELDTIVAVARGGLVIARLLSDFIGVKRMASITISYYRRVGERGVKPVIVSEVGMDLEGLKVLLVDDVADTGETLRIAASYLKARGAARLITCTAYVKPWCKYMPNYYSRMVDRWIVFPYEQAETARELVEKGLSLEQLVREGFSPLIIDYVRECSHRPEG
ncbi:MAG: phosphoribosyltransferase [Thermoprotei archaeon]|nr:MAG: phosphoribosyltransferase [Thermoprotei archaeon]